MLGLVGNAFAFQPKFEVEYTNYAWGYVNQGCLIDHEGNVYKYAYGQASDGKGIVPSGKMSEADLKFADSLVEKIHGAKYSEQISASNSGTKVWTAYSHYGGAVKLQAQGDYEGKNEAPETEDLLKLINGLCQ